MSFTKAYGKYFDGHTSKPYDVELEIWPEKKISFFYNNRKLNWNFEEVSFEKNSDTLYITRKENHAESLRIDNPYVINLIYQSAKKSRNISWYQNILDLGFKFYAIATVTVVAAIALFYVFVIPWMSERVTEITPVEFDNKIGDSQYNQMESILEIDQKKSRILQEFASNIDFETSRKLTFKVVNDSEVNAYALPNGTILVHSGILDKIYNYEQLAALLGHEATHVKERHSVKILSRAISGYIIVSAVTGDVNGIMSTIADNANQLNNLSYSRDFEESSDAGSYQILRKNKINPKGLEELFSILKEKEGLEIPKILSTHPITNDRIHFAKKLVHQNEYTSIPHQELEQLFTELKK